MPALERQLRPLETFRAEGVNAWPVVKAFLENIEAFRRWAGENTGFVFVGLAFPGARRLIDQAPADEILPGRSETADRFTLKGDYLFKICRYACGLGTLGHGWCSKKKQQCGAGFHGFCLSVEGLQNAG